MNQHVTPSLISLADPRGDAPQDLSLLKRRVRILMADYPAAMAVPHLLRALHTSAPNLDLAIQPWTDAAHATQALEQGDVDIAIAVFPKLPPAIQRRVVLQERYVVAMRQHHPAAQRLTLTQWLSYPHLLVSGNGAMRDALDETLAMQGMTRRVGMVVPSFTMVPSLLVNSDLIAMLPIHCVPKPTDKQEGALACFRPPLQVAELPMHLVWHRRADDDLAVQHVAHTLENIFQKHIARN